MWVMAWHGGATVDTAGMDRITSGIKKLRDRMGVNVVRTRSNRSAFLHDFSNSIVKKILGDAATAWAVRQKVTEDVAGTSDTDYATRDNLLRLCWRLSRQTLPVGAAANGSRWTLFHRTIERMIELAELHMLSLHINVREDMAYELAALISMITRKVVEDRLSERPLEEIGFDTVSRECLGDFFASNNRKDRSFCV